MLSYQHSYHAGNFADVVKHLILIETIRYLKQKAKPIICIDTHAGRGWYPLEAAATQKIKEFSGGIEKIWQAADLPEALKNYLEWVKKNNPEQRLINYPGSPRLMAQMLDKNDRLFCYELHPGEFQILRQNLKSFRIVKAFSENGLTGSLRLLPPKERRGLVLIDPSYEIKEEYIAVVQALVNLIKKFSTGCFLLWYPVVDRARNRAMEKALINSGIVNVQLFELGIKPDSQGLGMTACGMIAVNPPWTLRQTMAAALPWLAVSLGINNQGFYRIEQLVPE